MIFLATSSDDFDYFGQNFFGHIIVELLEFDKECVYRYFEFLELTA